MKVPAMERPTKFEIPTDKKSEPDNRVMKVPTIPASTSINTPLPITQAIKPLIKLERETPGVLDEPKNWLTLKEAVHFLHVSRRTVVRMCETMDTQTGRPYLRAWRPTPGTLMICRRSLQEFCKITQSDPEFWQRRGRERTPLSAAAMRKSRRRSHPMSKGRSKSQESR